jgi:radical SAM-linked protein
MLPEKITKRDRISKFDRPFLAEPITVRVIFEKRGNLQFFSHLDLQRTWQKVLVRASIPMWYTKGFNPHSKIVFGVPLPVGSESVCEMVDLKIDRLIRPDEIKAQLNAELTDEMQVREVYVPTTKYSDVAFAEYEITVGTAAAKSAQGALELTDRINAMFETGAEPIIMTKRSKSGDKEIDILTLTKSVGASVADSGIIKIKAILAAGSSENLNPEYIITAMRDRLGILAEGAPFDEEWYTILRLGYFNADGSVFK